MKHEIQFDDETILTFLLGGKNNHAMVIQTFRFSGFFSLLSFRYPIYLRSNWDMISFSLQRKNFVLCFSCFYDVALRDKWSKKRKGNSENFFHASLNKGSKQHLYLKSRKKTVKWMEKRLMRCDSKMITFLKKNQKITFWNQISILIMFAQHFWHTNTHTWISSCHFTSLSFFSIEYGRVHVWNKHR